MDSSWVSAVQLQLIRRKPCASKRHMLGRLQVCGKVIPRNYDGRFDVALQRLLLIGEAKNITGLGMP